MQEFQDGESKAGDQLLHLVYEELRRLATTPDGPGKSSDRTLQPTALVHEAWLRMVDADGKAHFENRAHFFTVAGEAMRCILIDRARRKLALRHGGGQIREDIDQIEIAAPDSDDRLVAVHEALERFTVIDPEKAQVVKLRYFVGMSVEETAQALGIGERTARRHWTFARAWLFDSIRKSSAGAS